MAFSLSEAEIHSRLTRLRNLEVLHAKLKQRNEKLEARIKEQDAIILKQAAVIETLLLRVAELEKMVFGERGGTDDAETDALMHRTEQKRHPVERTKASYRRKTPKKSRITARKRYRITNCTDCGTKLTKRSTVKRYIEDIVLPTLTKFLSTVTLQFIEKGYCEQCRKYVSAIPIPKHTVILGQNVRSLIVSSLTVLRLSFSLVRAQLRTTYGMDVSDGEISAIQESHARTLLPEYEAMKTRIRGQPGAHYDETSWNVQKETRGNYGWVMTGTEDDEMVFTLGKTRGGGNADELRGDSTHVGITDDYAGYEKRFQKHALCWGHPHRKFRDLARVKTLTPDKHRACVRMYVDFSLLYAKVRRAAKLKPFNLTVRKRLTTRYMKEFIRVTAIRRDDPEKVKTIKRTLCHDREKYFTCILYEGIPPDNNKAERSLRHLVIKRKTSLGSKTDKGARAMGILMSVLLSLRNKHPDGTFFPAYQKLLEANP
jgi:transposase